MMAKGDIRLTLPEFNGATIDAYDDTSHAPHDPAADFRVMLCTSSSTLRLADTNNGGTLAMDVVDLDDVTTLGEISTGGYTANAAGADSILGTLTLNAVPYSNASYVKWDAADRTFNNLNTGATISGILIFWSTALPNGSNWAVQYPLVWIDLTGSTIATNGGDIEIVWASDGIMRLNA